jgi:hypothetical protein
VPGTYPYVIARTKYLDEQFVHALKECVPQIVLLGSGYDIRAIRYQTQNQDSTVFELDTPALLKDMQLALKRNRIEISDSLNGLSPPNSDNVIDDEAYAHDYVIIRNVGCPPEWPGSGDAWDDCPSPGGATGVEIVQGGAARFLAVQDSSTVTMTGGTLLGDLRAADTSTITIVGRNFEVDGVPVPYGDLTAEIGTLTGTLASGDPIDNTFWRGGTLTLVKSAEPPPGTLPALSPWSQLALMAGLVGAGLGVWRGRGRRGAP